jgi:hypothetical protein
MKNITMPHEGPQTAEEAAFADVMRGYHRRAGRHAAYALLDRLVDAFDDGADRGELRRLALDALAALPTAH